jgi:hypothetical protein
MQCHYDRQGRRKGLCAIDKVACSSLIFHDDYYDVPSFEHECSLHMQESKGNHAHNVTMQTWNVSSEDYINVHKAVNSTLNFRAFWLG